MNSRGTGDHPSQAGFGRRRLVMTTQLLKAVVNMRHIDELFSWLAHTIVQDCDVQVIAFWAAQANRTGQISTRLRTLVGQDSTLPQQVVANNQVVALSDSILSTGHSNLIQPVGGVFSNYQADLLRRYGLNYFSSYFLNSNTLLPPALNSNSAETIPTPTAIAAVLFFRQVPSQDILSTINLLLEQAIAVAENRHLLLSTATSIATTSGRVPTLSKQTEQQQPLLRLYELIPQRIEDGNLVTSSNPLASTLLISDKQARRLYAAIDGGKSFSELCLSTNLDPNEAFKALKILLAQKRIQLYEPGGLEVDSSLLLKES